MSGQSIEAKGPCRFWGRRGPFPSATIGSLVLRKRSLGLVQPYLVFLAVAAVVVILLVVLLGGPAAPGPKPIVPLAT